MGANVGQRWLSTFTRISKAIRFGEAISVTHQVPGLTMPACSGFSTVAAISSSRFYYCCCCSYLFGGGFWEEELCETICHCPTIAVVSSSALPCVGVPSEFQVPLWCEFRVKCVSLKEAHELDAISKFLFDVSFDFPFDKMRKLRMDSMRVLSSSLNSELASSSCAPLI